MRILTALLAAAALAAVPATAQGAVQFVQVIPFSTAEGALIDDERFIARFSDVDANACVPAAYDVRVAWGDGTVTAGDIGRTEQFHGIRGSDVTCNFWVVDAHRYRVPGTYTLSVTACRDGECSPAGTNTVVVEEAAVSGQALPISTVAGEPFAADVAQFDDDNRLAQPSDYSAVIDWGDGTTSPGQVSGEDGRFRVSGGHTYAASGDHVVRVSLVQNGLVRVTSDPGLVSVAAATVALPPRIIANSVAGSPRARPALRLSSRTIGRSSLRRGLRVRITAPSASRAIRVAVLKVASRPRTLRRVTVRLRGGRVSGGRRVVTVRVPFAASLRRRMRPGRYALQFRVGGGGLASAEFRVR